MCGFAGIYLLDQNAATVDLSARVRAMAHALAHRGPDRQSESIESFAAVGFRRLAIVDLSAGGDQPVRGGDERIQVFCNGEIYNHLELRERLRRDHGVDVRHGSDVAVLPHLYEHYGPEFVTLLNGMFAICVLDGRDRSCRLYRDRLGIKPLYFARSGERVVFGSELQALLASGLVPRELDEAQLVPFLELFYVPGQATMCRGVEKLMPGERLVLERNAAPRRERYWRLAEHVRPVRGDRTEELEELDALLADATRLQLMADVPLGISLSGGLDSSLIAHYARQGSADVRAFTIAFPDTDPAELAAAREVCRTLGIEQVELSAASGEFLRELDATTAHNDEPIADPAMYPALCVARAAKDHVKVLLAGTGADELFAGYGHYRLTRRATTYRLLAHVLGDGLAARAVGMQHPPAERAALRAFGRDRLPWHARAMTHLTAADRTALQPLVRRDHLGELAESFRASEHLDGRNQQLCADAETYLPHQLLNLLDRSTMACSIEGRVPFLDHRVAEFALSIHGDHKVGGEHGDKHLLRRLAARHLPATVARRHKHGFPNALSQWLSADALPAIRSQLLDRGTFVADTFPRPWLCGLLQHADSLANNALTVHSLLVLASWHRVFCERSPSHLDIVAATDT